MAEKKSIFLKLFKIPVLAQIQRSVALKTLVASLLSFIAVIVVLVYLNIRAQTNLLLQQERSVLETQQSILQGKIEQSRSLALALATLIANEPEIQSTLYDRDQKHIQNLVEPGFQALTPILGKSLLAHFVIPKATSFLRLHNLTQYGDDLIGVRPAAVNVNTTGEPVSGIEVGRFTVGIRGIVPVKFEGEHIGSVEFGERLTSEYLQSIKKQFNIESAMYFDQKSPEVKDYFEAQKIKTSDPFYLMAESWGKGESKRGAPDDIRMQTVQTKSTQTVYDDPGKQAVVVMPLKDFAGKVIGVWEIYLDRTAMLAQIADSRNISIGVGVGIAIFGVLFIWWLVNFNVGRPIREISSVYERIGMGDFTARSSIESDDEMGEMANSLNAMLDNTLALIQTSEERDTMQSSIMKLLNEISNLAGGDLTQRAEVTEDFTGAIADAFNNMVEQLSQVVRHVKEATIQVSSTSNEVSVSTESLAQASEMQAVQVSDTIAAINEMATSIQQVSESAVQSASVSETAMTHSKDGATAVRDTNGAMDAIREHVQETARAIKRLGESSQEIGNIVQLINDIADRTSILALNASIQAAMAGDAGRGFAVVAEEVQRLAERSTNATKQIETLIKNIQGEINEAGTSMEESIQRVVEGSKLADNAYSKLQDIEAVTIQLGEFIQSISMASKQQARASENIAKTMEEIGDISSQNSAASRQTAVAMKKMADTAEELRVSVGTFKLEV